MNKETMKYLQKQFLGLLDTHSIASDSLYYNDNIFIVNIYDDDGINIGQIICECKNLIDTYYTLYLDSDKIMTVKIFELYHIIEIIKEKI